MSSKVDITEAHLQNGNIAVSLFIQHADKAGKIWNTRITGVGKDRDMALDDIMVKSTSAAHSVRFLIRKALEAQAVPVSVQAQTEEPQRPAAPSPEPSTPFEAEDEDEDEDLRPSIDSLQAMKRADLQAVAEDEGVEIVVKGNTSKASIIDAIMEHREEVASDDAF